MVTSQSERFSVFLRFINKSKGFNFKFKLCSEMMNKQIRPAIQLQSKSQFALIEDKKEGEVLRVAGA